MCYLGVNRGQGRGKRHLSFGVHTVILKAPIYIAYQLTYVNITRYRSVTSKIDWAKNKMKVAKQSICIAISAPSIDRSPSPRIDAGSVAGK